jgi:hypothetical protein
VIVATEMPKNRTEPIVNLGCPSSTPSPLKIKHDVVAPAGKEVVVIHWEKVAAVVCLPKVAI